MKKYLEVCPHCGGEIQATIKVTHDFSLHKLNWVCVFSEDIETSVYCENDCDLSNEYSEEKIPNLLEDFNVASIL